MFRSGTICAAIVLGLAGCSNMLKIDRDPTPVHPTAVTETRLISQGIAEFPAFEGTTRTYTRANMQRRESTVSGGDGAARFLEGGGAEARILRLDRKVAWTLDAKNKQFVECPLKGCPASLPNNPAGKLSPVNDYEAECRLKVNTTTVTVEQTGRSRSINGFDAEQYAINWLVRFQDNASRISTSTVNIDLWSAPSRPGLNQVIALERQYARARDAIPRAVEPLDRSLVLPDEVGRMLDSYLSRYVSPTDRSAFLAAAKKLDKVRGLPILVTVTWRFSGAGCSVDKTMKDEGGKPLFTFMSEVKSAKLEALHDSLFAPPKNYKQPK